MQQKENFTLFLNIIYRHWLLLLLCSSCCAIAAYLFAKFAIPPRYRADVLFYIGRLDIDDRSRNEAASITLSRELYVGAQLVLDYTELIKSKRILALTKEQIAQQKPEYLIPFAMEGNMHHNTRLLTLSITAKDPDAACFIANTFSHVFNDELSSLFELKSFRVVDRAEGAVKVFPVPWLFGFCAFCISGGCLFAFFLLKLILDTRFHSPEEISEALQLPIIGSIPLDRELAKQHAVSDKDEGNRIVTLSNDGMQKRFGIREAFWGIRTNLFYSDFRSQQGARIIAITSALAGEGKTFVSANLSATLADFGQRTLIINCDLRKPALSQALGVYSNIGLVNVLVDQCPLENALQKNLFQRKLDALFCGPIPLNPLKLLDSAAFRKLLENLRKEYDYIILDTPPCLEVSDGLCLGKMADGVILVSRLSEVRENNARKAVDLLHQAKVSLLGIIANGIITQHKGYYYQASTHKKK